MKKGEFKLYVCNFLPETLFIKLYGNEVYKTVISKIENHNYCAACGHEPKYSDVHKVLTPHIYNIDKNNPINSKVVNLCKACHSTQHIDISINNQWVKLVNSSLSQATLVSASRYGDLKKLYASSKIINLKKTPTQLLQEIQNGSFKISSTLKVVFTNNFIFNDL